uniref:SCP domain-containing protein n=1 Tax=Trichobilharzia regenti TaxID=157069 RepID=A0AA85IXS6_TRIRE|nr:unnamed protein product [Trichobilharzia regenti]
MSCSNIIDGNISRFEMLAWNQELASQAKALSKTCRFGFNNPTSRKFHPVGQNIAAYQTVEQAMQEWFGEHKYYNFKNNKCSDSCGNYMQMAFANTTDIGCGVTKCPYSENFKYGLFIVCNYGPGANFHVRPFEAKNINEVCPVTASPSVQSGSGKWQATKGTTKFNARNCYCYK